MEPPVCGGRDDRRRRNPFCRCTPKEMAAPKEHISALLRAKNAFLGKGGGRQSDGHAPRFGIRLCRVGKQADGDAGRSRPCYQKRDVIGLFRAFLHGGHAIGEGLCVMLAGDLNA